MRHLHTNNCLYATFVFGQLDMCQLQGFKGVKRAGPVSITKGDGKK